MTTTTIRREGRSLPSAVDERLVRRLARWFALASVWVWLGFALLAWGITRSNAATVGVTESVVGSLSVTPRNFLVGFAITVMVAWFVPHVATGGTRRSYVTSAAIVVVLGAAAYAVLLTLAFRLEVGIYEANGWPLVQRTGHLFSSGEQSGLVLAESFAVAAALALSGLAIGAGYRRLGGLRGTYALLVTATPALVATAVLEVRASSGLGAALGVRGLSAPATFAVLAALALVSLVTAYRLAHGAPARLVGTIR